MARRVKVFNSLDLVGEPHDVQERLTDLTFLEREINRWAEMRAVKLINVSLAATSITDGQTTGFVAIVLYDE